MTKKGCISTQENSALPRGTIWTPVDEVLLNLEKKICPKKTTEFVSLFDSVGRILSKTIFSPNFNPPYSNSAVDGFGFSGPSQAGSTTLKLLPAVAAAGKPFTGKVFSGEAIKILTGAALPRGVDTVLLNEDVDSIDDNHLTFRISLKAGSNIRKIGEDVKTKQKLFESGRKIQPQDLAIMASVGIEQVEVFSKLTIGVISTGNELIDLDTRGRQQLEFGQIYDSNRPMLSTLIKGWGNDVIDFGIMNDDKINLRNKFNNIVDGVDAIVVSGGASTGDEDYVSRLIKEEGVLENWRVAMKPGRPLAIGYWKGTPVFALPGNPVAAFVCGLIFLKPFNDLLSGMTSSRPQSYLIPANFSKQKKVGRREYLRAKITENGFAEIYPSEGSGRIFSLGWSTGLIEVLEDTNLISKGDLVNFIPYSSFEVN